MRNFLSDLPDHTLLLLEKKWNVTAVSYLSSNIEQSFILEKCGNYKGHRIKKQWNYEPECIVGTAREILWCIWL